MQKKKKYLLLSKHLDFHQAFGVIILMYKNLLLIFCYTIASNFRVLWNVNNNVHKDKIGSVNHLQE